LKLYRTSKTVFVEENVNYYPVSGAEWDDLICDANLRGGPRNGHA
jgi:hypothetical protein